MCAFFSAMGHCAKLYFHEKKNEKESKFVFSPFLNFTFHDYIYVLSLFKNYFNPYIESISVIQCLHWGRGSTPTPGVYSAAIPLGKGLIVHYLVFSDGTQNWRSRVCAKSHLTLKKSVGPCGLWWWMTVHQCTREGNSLKPNRIHFKVVLYGQVSSFHFQ